jgi:hypothetical protein
LASVAGSSGANSTSRNFVPFSGGRHADRSIGCILLGKARWCAVSEPKIRGRNHRTILLQGDTTIEQNYCVISVVEPSHNPPDVIGNSARTDRYGDDGKKEDTAVHFYFPKFASAFDRQETFVALNCLPAHLAQIGRSIRCSGASRSCNCLRREHRVKAFNEGCLPCAMITVRKPSRSKCLCCAVLARAMSLSSSLILPFAFQTAVTQFDDCHPASKHHPFPHH